MDAGVGFDVGFAATAAAVTATGTADKRGEAGVAQAVAASNDASASRWYDFTDQFRSQNVGGTLDVLVWVVAISRALVAGVLSGCCGGGTWRPTIGAAPSPSSRPALVRRPAGVSV